MTTETATGALLQAVVDALPNGVVVLDADGRIVWVNPAARRILGVGADDLLAGSDGRAVARNLRSAQRADGHAVELLRPDGSRVWLSASWGLLDESNLGSPLLVSFTDITAERSASERLAHQANHDSLTGLPNRAQVLAHISESLDADGDSAVGAVLFIDLDNLKRVNDTLGHEAGDAALKVVARRLEHSLRCDDMVARLGGDEFVAVLSGAITADEVDRLTARLHAVLAEPVLLAGATVKLGASVGIAEVADAESRDAAQLLRDADAAMYQAKAAGRGRSRRFIAAA